jgi:hypothetical protein
MANYVPTQDQVMAQLRIVIPAIGTIVSAVGFIKPDAVGSAVAGLMTAVGPIAYMIVAIWSFVANSRRSILIAAAKPLDANTPAPKIILAPQEKTLADSLPTNVVAAKTVSEVDPVAKGT